MHLFSAIRILVVFMDYDMVLLFRKTGAFEFLLCVSVL